jgi:hypothetical protein
MKLNTFPDQIRNRPSGLLVFWRDYLAPTNTEFKKHSCKTFYAGAAHMAAPEMQILN